VLILDAMKGSGQRFIKALDDGADNAKSISQDPVMLETPEMLEMLETLETLEMLEMLEMLERLEMLEMLEMVRKMTSSTAE
jgi:hypothetical protein